MTVILAYGARYFHLRVKKNKNKNDFPTSEFNITMCVMRYIYIYVPNTKTNIAISKKVVNLKYVNEALGYARVCFLRT